MREREHRIKLLELQIKEKDQEIRLYSLRAKELRKSVRYGTLKPIKSVGAMSTLPALKKDDELRIDSLDRREGRVEGGTVGTGESVSDLKNDRIETQEPVKEEGEAFELEGGKKEMDNINAIFTERGELTEENVKKMFHKEDEM